MQQRAKTSNNHEVLATSISPLPTTTYTLNTQSTIMHYIRLLKAPRYSSGAGNRSGSISALITITSDLGDNFFPKDVTITAELLQKDGTSEYRLASREYQWKLGMRSLKIELSLVSLRTTLAGAAFLVVSGVRGATPPADDISQPTSHDLEIISAYSPSFTLILEKEAGRFVQRRLSIGQDKILRIWEETGESIARHVW